MCYFSVVRKSYAAKQFYNGHKFRDGGSFKTSEFSICLGKQRYAQSYMAVVADRVEEQYTWECFTGHALAVVANKSFESISWLKKKRLHKPACW